MFQQVAEHSRRRGLTMGSSDGHTATGLHQIAQGLGVGEDGQAATSGFDDLRVVSGGRSGDDDQLSVADLLGAVPDCGPNAATG